MNVEFDKVERHVEMGTKSETFQQLVQYHFLKEDLDRFLELLNFEITLKKKQLWIIIELNF
jgi:hypothetical protein